MKAFAIQTSNDGYIRDTHQPLTLISYYSLYTMPDLDESKHWRTAKLAQKWLDSAIARSNKKLSEIKSLKKYLARQDYVNSYGIATADRNLVSMGTIILKLDGAKVIQIDDERPNFSNSTKPKYRGYRGSDLEIVTVTTGKYSCESCGVILKKIPFMTIGSSNVCIPCMKLRQDKIDKAFEDMDEDIRTELTNNFIVSKI